MDKREYIFLGAPACGKGTQTNILAQELQFPHIDTGSLLRASIKAQTPEGIIAQETNNVPLEPTFIFTGSFPLPLPWALPWCKLCRGSLNSQCDCNLQESPAPCQQNLFPGS